MCHGLENFLKGKTVKLKIRGTAADVREKRYNLAAGNAIMLRGFYLWKIKFVILKLMDRELNFPFLSDWSNISFVRASFCRHLFTTFEEIGYYYVNFFFRFLRDEI